MLTRINQLLKEKENFSIETTLSTRSYINFVKEAKKAGFTITLVFFWLNSRTLARQRVEKRVMEGGHDIPVQDIERRFYRGLKNLGLFIDLVDDWYI